MLCLLPMERGASASTSHALRWLRRKFQVGEFRNAEMVHWSRGELAAKDALAQRGSQFGRPCSPLS